MSDIIAIGAILGLAALALAAIRMLGFDEGNSA